MSERNEDIIRFYQNGMEIGVLAASFALSHQRIRQILRKAGVWRKKPIRSAFLGVDVTDQTKEALKAEAERRGVSVSRLTSDTLEGMLAAAESGEQK